MTEEVVFANSATGLLICPRSHTSADDRSVVATGAVKWFNDAKGFGFVTEDSGGEDVFVHHIAIGLEGFRTLAEGQKIEFDVTRGPKGLQAANLRTVHSGSRGAEKESLAPLPASRALRKDPPEPPPPPLVFISYSHSDSEWLGRAKVHLRPLARAGEIDIWDDTVILAGEQWKSGIAATISTCRAALLLLSADFLASDFIHRNELPPILTRARDRMSLVILGLVVSAVYLDDSPLGDIQMVNDPKKPLNTMNRGASEEVLKKLAKAVKKALEH